MINKFLHILLIFSFFQFTNCTKKSGSDEDFSSVTPPPTTPGPTPGPVQPDPDPPAPTVPRDPIRNTPVGTIDATGFWINVKAIGTNGSADIYVNSDEGFGEDCFVPTQTQESKNITCFVDILEGILYTHELEIQYNVPPGLCEYLRFTPAWHWNESSGVGPKTITLTTTEGQGTEEDSVSCQASDPDFNDFRGPCSDHPELTDIGDSGGPKCIYNRSYLDPKNPDCCFGEYTLIKKNGEEEAEEEIRSWGGDVKSCLGGMVQVAWDEFNDNNYPQSLLYTIPINSAGNTIGMNAAHKIPSNIDTTESRFSTIANFYTPPAGPAIQGLHEHDGYVLTEESNLPYAIDPIDDLSGTPYDTGEELIPGTQAHLFDCEDDAFELKHRIEVYTREWNTLTDFVLYKTSGGQIYDPDVNELEEQCGYGSIFGNHPCNDRFDLDDIVKSLTNGYETSIPNAEQRRSYFPGVKY